MSDPGTCLAIVSLALQVSKGLLGYYDLWTHADEDVAEIQRSLLALGNIFTQLSITLEKPNLSEDIISIIRITMKGCDSNVKKLEEILDKIKREGAPEKLRTKFKNFNRRVLQMFQHGEIMRVQYILNELREDLNMVVSLLSLNTTATSLDDLRKVVADLTTLQNSNKERIEMEKEKNREAQRRALIEWLAAPDISAAHLSAQDQREEGTGEWFLESQEFQEWVNTGRSMWLAGDVGCGKTVLCSSVIEELKGRAPRRGDRIAYFYFTFSDTDRHGVAGFLKTMIRQLCLTNSVDTLMEALYQRCGLDPPSTKQMQATLLAYLEKVCASEMDVDVTEAPQVYMVLDGLDEIPYGPDRTTLLLLLNQMAKGAYPLLHILVSSRPERDIEKEILGSQHWKTFPFSSGSARNDVEIYVANQIKLTPRLASLPDHTKHDIQKKLVVGAGGMFRWTALQMQELKKKRILRGHDVQNILSSLPKSLDATYERVLLQIDSELIYEAKTALQWLSCCLRPLYLEELVDASITNPDEEVPFSEDYRISPFDLLDLLPGLVKVNPPPDLSEGMFLPNHYTVTLAHFSVKEYLVSSRILDSFSHSYAINLDLAHRHVVRSSLAYIGHCLSVGSSYPHHQHGVVRFPLQMYAYGRWEMHAKLVSGQLDQVWVHVLETFRKPTAALMWCWLSKLREEGAAYHFDIPFQAFLSPDWPTNYLLCRAIGSGIEPLVRVVLGSTWLNLTGQLGLGNPFSLALISRSGSSPRNKLQSSSNLLSAGSFPSLGDDSLPRMLLESGYRPTAHDLLLAVRHGTTALLSLMIERAQKFLFSDLMEALDQAVTSRRLQVARMFLRQLLSGTHSHPNQTFYTQDDEKKEVFEIVLAHAVEKDSPRLVSFLIDSLPDELLGQLDFDSLFLRAVVGGRCHVAATIRRSQSSRISEKTVSHVERWQSVIPRDDLCFALLNLFASRCHTTKPRLRTRKTRKRIARDLIDPYALRLGEETIDEVLQVWLRLDESFEPLHRKGPVQQDIPLRVAIPNLVCKPLAAKLVLFLLLDCRHYPSIWSLYYQALVRLRPISDTIRSSLRHNGLSIQKMRQEHLERMDTSMLETLALAGRMSLRLACASHGKARETSPVFRSLNTEMNHMTFSFEIFTASDGRRIGNYSLISGFNLSPSAWPNQPCLMWVRVAVFQQHVYTLRFFDNSFKVASRRDLMLFFRTLGIRLWRDNLIMDLLSWPESMIPSMVVHDG